MNDSGYLTMATIGGLVCVGVPAFVLFAVWLAGWAISGAARREQVVLEYNAPSGTRKYNEDGEK